MFKVLNVFKIICVLGILTLAGCSKNTEAPVKDRQLENVGYKSDYLLESKKLVKELPGFDGIILTIVMNPVPVFYQDKPGSILISMTCYLTSPVNSFICVKLLRRDGEKEERISLVIRPNMTNVTFNTSLTNKNNLYIPDKFTIESLKTFAIVN